MQDYYVKRGFQFLKNRLWYSVLLSFLILFLCWIAISLQPFNLVTGGLFFCLLSISILGLWFGLLTSLGIVLLVLFLFGSGLIWVHFALGTQVLTVLEIVFWMSAFPLVAVVAGVYQQWVSSTQQENRQMKERFEDLVTIDEATGFDNEKRFYFEIEEEFSRSKRTGLPFTLIMFQIKYMKQFQELYGLKESEHLLSFVSKVLWEKTRMSDRKFRLREDTFALLLPNTGAENVDIVVQKLEENLKQHTLQKKAAEVKLTLAFGLSSYPNDFNDVTEMIQDADQGLQHYVQ